MKAKEGDGAIRSLIKQAESPTTTKKKKKKKKKKMERRCNINGYLEIS